MARILFISTREDSGWAESEELWSQAAGALARQHEVACSVQPQPESPPALGALAAKGVAVIPRESHPLFLARVLNPLLPNARKLDAVPPLEKTISTFRPDLAVISQIGNLDGDEAMETCAKLGVSYCNVIHSVPEGLSWPHDHEVERLGPLYQKSRRLFFVSQRNREFLEIQFAMELAHSKVVHNPFPASSKTAPPWPPSSTPLRLACVAPIDLHATGQDLLVDIFSRTKWWDREVRLDFYGTGPNQEMLQDRIGLAGLSNLILRGPAPDGPSIWADHHALVLPAREGGLPVALVEALLCGRPAVVTRVGGNAELVEDGRSGYVAAAPTAELLDQALERLWENRAGLSEMGLNARRTAEQKISSDPVQIFVDELAQLLPGTHDAVSLTEA